jgi:hypothetical protein
MPPLPCVPVEASPLGAFAALPQALSLRIFARVPVDTRLRCIELSRGFRALLAERSLWTRLQLPASFRCARADLFWANDRARAERSAADGLLRAAARKAGGLEALDMNGCERISCAALLAVVAANGGTLRELLVDGAFWSRCELLPEDAATHEEQRRYNPAAPVFRERDRLRLLTLLRLAPHLTVLGVNVGVWDVDLATAVEVLTNVPPYGPVRVRSLSLLKEPADETELFPLLTHLAAHAPLKSVDFSLNEAYVPGRAALEEMCSCAATGGWRELMFSNFLMGPAVAPALAQLLRVGALQTLIIADNIHEPLLDQPAAALLAAALRENSTLMVLELGAVDLFRDAAVATQIIGSLVGHPSLETLKLTSNPVRSIAVGKALGELVVANAPALRHLDVRFCELGDIGLGPLVAALPANTHLRELSFADNGMSFAFALDVFTPAVCANTSLRKLDDDALINAMAPDALAHVKARAAADEAA